MESSKRGIFLVCISYKFFMKVNEWNMQCINVIRFRKFHDIIHSYNLINNEQHVIDYSTKPKRLYSFNSLWLFSLKNCVFQLDWNGTKQLCLIPSTSIVMQLKLWFFNALNFDFKFFLPLSMYREQNTHIHGYISHTLILASIL